MKVPIVLCTLPVYLHTTAITDLAVIAMQEETPFCATITGLPAGGLDTDIVVDFEVADLTAGIVSMRLMDAVLKLIF